jgi:hypothetical protein
VGEHEKVEGNLLVFSVGAGVAGVGLLVVSRSSGEVRAMGGGGPAREDSVVIFHFSWKMQSDVWGTISDQGIVTHITGGNFAQSSITINGWLRDFLGCQGELAGRGQPV